MTGSGMAATWLLMGVLATPPDRPRPAAIRPAVDARGYRLYALGFEPETDDRDLNRRPDADRWERVREKGYPFYCRYVLDEVVPHEGRSALRLEPDGASAAIQSLPLSADRFHAQEVTGWIRTRDLERARAAIHLEWLAQDGRTVLGKAGSKPVGGTSGWQRVHFVADPPQDLRLGWMRLRIGVQAGPAGSDLRAAAWFDTIRIHERPRASLRTGEPANLFRADQSAPSITLLLSGLKTDVTRARLRITDVRGRQIQREEIAVTSESGTTAIGRFPLDIADPGLYRATVEVFADEATVLATRRLWLAICPGRTVSTATPDLGVVAAPRRAPRRLPELLGRVGTKWIKVTIDDADDTAAMEGLIRSLAAREVNVAGVLAGRWEPSGKVADLLASAGKGRHDRLVVAMAQYAGNIRAWQFGTDGDESLCVGTDVLSMFEGLTRTVGTLALEQPLGAAWSALHPLPPATTGLDFVSVDIGPEVPPDNIPTQIAGGGTTLWATVHLLDRSRFGREARLQDLVQRVVHAKRAGAERVFFAPLVDDRLGLLLDDGSPTEALLAWRTITEMLDGLPYIGSVPLSNDTPNALFGDAKRAVAVLWSPAGTRTERVDAAPGAEQVDILGRRRPLTGGEGGFQLTVGPMPLFVTNLRADLAATCASLRLEPRRATSRLAGPRSHAPTSIESEYRWHMRTLQFTNRFEKPIHGRLALDPPAGWRVEPRVIPFDVPPGARFERPIRISFPYSAPRGTNILQARWLIETDRRLRNRTEIPVRLGLSGISMRTSLQWAPDGNVAIRLLLENDGADRLRGSCYVTIRGAAGSANDPTPAEYGVFVLAPGGRVERRYVLGRAADLSGRTVRVSLRERGGRRFLNEDVAVPAQTPNWKTLQPASAAGADEQRRR